MNALFNEVEVDPVSVEEKVRGAAPAEVATELMGFAEAQAQSSVCAMKKSGPN